MPCAEYQRAVRLDDDLDEAHRLIGMALGRSGDQAQGFYQLGTAALLRGELEQAYSLYDRARPLLAEGTHAADRGRRGDDRAGAAGARAGTRAVDAARRRGVAPGQ